MTDLGYCRLCAELKLYSQLIPISKNEELDTKDLIYKVSQCFQLQISSDDNLPKTVCMDCCMQTDASYQFFQKVHKAQEILRSVIFKDNNNDFQMCFDTHVKAVSCDNIKIDFNQQVSERAADENDSKAEIEYENHLESIKIFSDAEGVECDDTSNIELNKNRQIESAQNQNFKKEFPNFIWFCSICLKITKTRDELIKHSEKHHDKLPDYSCNECQKTFPTSHYVNFIEHIRRHKFEFCCEICNKTFRHKSLYRRHMKYTHDQILNICEICSTEYKWTDLLKQHKLTAHNIVDDDNNSQSFETSKRMIGTNDSHPNYKLIRKKDGSIKKVHRNFEEEFPDYIWRCNVCSNISKSRSDLSKHFTIEHNKSVEYSCNECNKNFPAHRYKGFTRHVRQHNNNFPCKICGKIFNWKALLQKHVKHSHEQKVKYICAICSKEFKYPSSLKTHELLHKMGPNRKKYECDICHKMTLSEKSLAIHKQVHDESTKCFTCEKCGLTFRLKDTLEAHLKNIHTFIPEDKYPECPICLKKLKHEKQVRRHIRYSHHKKRFECETCGKQFYLLSHYKTHLTLHTGELPFECEYCKKRFRIKKGLMLHILQHTGEKPYCCFDCNHDFTDFSNYIKHMRRKHGVTSFKKVKKVTDLNRTDNNLNISSVE